MKKLTKKLWSHISDDGNGRQYVKETRSSSPKFVQTYCDLVREVAIISFNNPSLSLFYRGQRKEHTVVSHEDLEWCPR